MELAAQGEHLRGVHGAHRLFGRLHQQARGLVQAVHPGQGAAALAPHRQQVDRVAFGRLDLLPECVDGRVQGARDDALSVFPDLLQQGLAGDDLPRPFHRQPECVDLLRSQLHPAPEAMHEPTIEIDGTGREVEEGVLLGHTSRLSGSTRQRSDYSCGGGPSERGFRQYRTASS